MYNYTVPLPHPFRAHKQPPQRVTYSQTMMSSKLLYFAVGGAGGAAISAAFANKKCHGGRGAGASPFTQVAHSHCQVPCGIYDDGGRITSIKEDVTTITKAMKNIAALSGKSDAQSLNQAVRWINTKEQHSTNIQRTIGDYFLTQKVKEVPKGDDHYPQYLETLALHHAVLRDAMRAKQQTSTTVAAKLAHSVEHLEVVYGK